MLVVYDVEIWEEFVVCSCIVVSDYVGFVGKIKVVYEGCCFIVGCLLVI